MDDDKQDILEKLRQGLRDNKDFQEIDGAFDAIDCITSPTLGGIDLSDSNGSLIFPSPTYTYPNVNINTTYTGTATGANVFGALDTITINPPVFPDHEGKLSLQGDQADIEINGQSLMSMIQGIQDRLNMLCPDPSMEAEWDELRQLRQQYETKLAECREKSRAWKILQQLD